jgi:hypothetical protein
MTSIVVQQTERVGAVTAGTPYPAIIIVQGHSGA